MGWTPYAEAEVALGTRLARKVASGALPTYSDAGGQRWVWLQSDGAGGVDDVLWEVLAELRRLREALARLEGQVQAHGGAARAGRTVSMTTGAFRRFEALLAPAEARDEEDAQVA